MNIDGIEIFVEKLEGNGKLNFVLIHNAGGTHQFFTHQIKLLKKYGNVILLDLPGHGRSQAIASYAMDKLSLIIKAICEGLSLENIYFIGLNNGANIIVDVALNHRLPIKNIILIDPPIFIDKLFIVEINNFINQLDQPDYDKFVISLVDDLFIDTDFYNKEIAINAFKNVDKGSLQNIFKELIRWDLNLSNKLKNIPYSTLCILTDEHHCSYDKLRLEAPQFEIGKVVGSKCWATLEVPDQVNAMMERFIRLKK